MRYLVTGSGSGLGKFLRRELQAESFTRESHIPTLIETEQPYDAIIHCAVNARFNVTSANFYSYMADNLLLTQQLLSVPHKKFIFISTVDVYPKAIATDAKNEAEDDDFLVDNFRSLYGLFKLMAEKLVEKSAKDYLILRPVALLGADARENSLTRIIKDPQPNLTLAATSSFNYILHEDVLKFIQLAMEKDLQGIFNLAASRNISLDEVSQWLAKEVKFGKFHYDIGAISNAKAAAQYPAFANTSLQNIHRFLSMQGDQYAKYIDKKPILLSR